MLLIMVGNMASIFMQVYIAKASPIYHFFPHVLHTVPFISLSLLWDHVDIFMVLFICSCHRPNVQWGFCLPFPRWKSNNQSHCNLKLKVKMSILLFWCALLKFYNTKYRHSLSWCSQNTRGCTSMLWLRSSQHHISCAFDHDDLHHSCISCTVECLVADLLGSLWPNLLAVWITFLGSEFELTSLTILLSCQTVLIAILVLFVSTMDNSTRLKNTLWKILLTHSYCPIALCFTNQHILQ